MAITYHAGRRIQGLERTGSTPTFEDDFTTRKTGWSANTTRCVIDNTTDEEMDLSIGDGGNYAELLSYPLDATASDTQWVLDFDYELETLSAGTTGGGQIAVGLSGEGTNGFTTAQDFLGLLQEHDNGSYEWFACIDTDGTALNSTGGDTQLTNLPTTATQYHFRVIRLTATSYKVQSFSGSARTSDLLIEEKTGTCASTIQTLTHIKCHARQYSSGNRTATVRVDNINFYNGVISAVVPAGDEKPTNVQVGSRYEETNTRKIYYRDDLDFKELDGAEATNYRSESWYEQLSGETP